MQLWCVNDEKIWHFQMIFCGHSHSRKIEKRNHSYLQMLLFIPSWNDIIGTSSATMNKFQLKLRRRHSLRRAANSSWIRDFDEVLTLKRKFKTIEINFEFDCCDEYIEKLIQIAKRHGSHVTKLKVDNASFQDSANFIRILENFPVLEKLIIWNAWLRKYFNGQTVNLANLKRLEVKSFNWQILKLISCKKLSNLDLIVHEGLPSLDVIQCYNNLENLRIDCNVFGCFFSADCVIHGVISQTFNLKTFECDYNYNYFSKKTADEIEIIQKNFAIFLRIFLEFRYIPSKFFTRTSSCANNVTWNIWNNF